MHDSQFQNWLLDPVSKIDSTNLFEPNIGDENLSFHVHTNNLRQFKTHLDGEPIGAVSNWPNEPEKKNNIIWNEDNLFDSTYVFGIQVWIRILNTKLNNKRGNFQYVKINLSLSLIQCWDKR